MNEIELQLLYEAQLTAQTGDECLPAHDRDAAAAVLEACDRLLGKGLKPADENRTWVFSDPHFGDPTSLHVFRRPFRTTAEEDSFLFEDWRAKVTDRDVVVCIGDVSIKRPTDGLIDRIRRAPGYKILVPGNHDASNITRLRRAFNHVGSCAHLPGEPHLLFTHVPLDDVPADCVNVHGHVHRKTSVDQRRINVCVEQVWYRLVPMTDIKLLARRMKQAPLRGNATTNLFISWAKSRPAMGRPGD